MAKWIEHDANGLSTEELLSLCNSMRDQRNEHRAAIFNQLQFYFTIVSVLLSVNVTLTTFSIPYIVNNIQDVLARSGLFALLLILPIGILIILSQSMKNLKKEYEKLIEYLTVEQKIEAALGLLGPIKISKSIPKPLPYPDDESILFTGWVKDRFAQSTSTVFLKNVVERKTVFYTPLKNTLQVLFWLNIALIVIIIVLAVVALYI